MAASFVETFASQTMNLDLSKTMVGVERKLEELCTDIFLIVIRMREAEDLGEPPALRKLIKYYIGLFESNCMATNVNEEAIGYAKYALIALLDETVLSFPGKCRDFWISSPMQLEYFGDNIAGQEFYRKLDKLLLEPERMRPVLEVYYICLSLGFEGKYKIANPQERTAIVDNLGMQLSTTLKTKFARLSPHGKRLEATVGRGKSFGQKMVPLWIFAAGSAAVVAITWGVLAFMAGARLQDLMTLLR